MIKSFIHHAVAEGSRLLAWVKSSPKRLLIAIISLMVTPIVAEAQHTLTFNCAVYSSPTTPKIIEKKDFKFIFLTETILSMECNHDYNLYGLEEAGKLGSKDSLFYDARVGTYGYVVAYRVKPNVCTLEYGYECPTLIHHVTITNKKGRTLSETLMFQYATGEETLYCNKYTF